MKKKKKIKNEKEKKNKKMKKIKKKKEDDKSFFNLFYREVLSIYFIENNFFWLDGLYIEKLKNKYKYNILGAD